MPKIDPRAADVVRFWRDAGQKAWFEKDKAFDTRFHDSFLELHYAAAARELDGWMAYPEGALALMILLDQFPRNIYRGTPLAFATDGLARREARLALEAGADGALG